MATRTATRTLISDLNPRAVDEARDEDLRRQGRFRELVLRMLAPEAAADEAWTPEANGVWQTRVIRRQPARRTEPTRADLAAAFRESPDPVPEAIRDHIISRYLLETKPRKTGPKASRRTLWEEITISACYQRVLHVAREAHEADD